MTALWAAVGQGAALAAAAVLCLAGLALSCLSISGTWLVAAAALVAWLWGGRGFPTAGTVIAFALAAGLVEVIEALAGAWGVRRRGGSRLAGAAAVAGGLLGLALGGLIPVPLLGSLAGMLAGSFGLVYAVERRRLGAAGGASHVAWGAVAGRVVAAGVKAGATLGMTGYLAWGIIRAGAG